MLKNIYKFKERKRLSKDALHLYFLTYFDAGKLTL